MQLSQVSKYPGLPDQCGPSEVNCPEEVCVSVPPVVGVFQLMNTGPTFKWTSTLRTVQVVCTLEELSNMEIVFKTQIQLDAMNEDEWRGIPKVTNSWIPFENEVVIQVPSQFYFKPSHFVLTLKFKELPRSANCVLGRSCRMELTRLHNEIHGAPVGLA